MDKRWELIKRYLEELEKKTKEAYEIAKKAREKGLDPEPFVEIDIANDMAERVEALVSFKVPQLRNSGLSQRIRELEEEYGFLDWRVGLKIAEEVALGKFCKFNSKEEAIDAGIRVGLAYITMGVVSAPIEGIVGVKIKNRLDGKPYLAIYYAGPIRTAGGTASAYSVLLGDYLRIRLGLYPYDPTEDEIQRYIIEVEDYHARHRLQYKPKPEEIEYLIKHIPVEITGDATDDREVSGKKDLPRVETNCIRGGMCLTLCEGVAQKLKKFKKKMKKWAKDWGLEHWVKISEEFVELQKKLYGGGESESSGITPNYKYLEESVAGRPIFSEPMAKGGFRIRYGRSRVNGLAGAGIHPATMILTDGFIAIGTQLAIERPGKKCVVMPVDTIEGPIVKLKDGSVIRVETYEQALEIKDKVEKILFLGDILFAFGEFLHNGHPLVPSGYVEEWWIQEVEKALKEKNISLEKFSKGIKIEKEFLEKLLKDPLRIKPSGEVAVKISKFLGVPLHPRYTYHWHDISKEDFEYFYKKFKEAKKDGKIEFEMDEKLKRILEDLCIPHRIEEGKIVIEGDDAFVLKEILKKNVQKIEGKDGLEAVNSVSEIEIRRKVGCYLGARMGRPEKSSIRKMKGRPHMLFPVGQEGGRMRNLIEACEKGYITAEVPLFFCPKCQKWTLYPKCEVCGEKTIRYYKCRVCGKIVRTPVHCGVNCSLTETRKIDPRHYLKIALNNLKLPTPQLLKGVRGMSSAEKIPERIEKGILRAKYNLYVNKDGTIRFDAIEAPITHFRPREIGISVEKLRELGYKYDIYGNPLVSEDQIVELFPQDIIIPDPEMSDKEEKSAASVFFRVANFIDELLEKFYGLPRYYNLKSKEDLVGHLVLCLAPHTSAGIVARIIGFSKTQTFLAHPYLHAAMRRNCYHPETKVVFIWNNEEKVLTFEEAFFEALKNWEKIEVDKDSMIVYPKDEIFVYSLDVEKLKVVKRKVKFFIKIFENKKWYKFVTESGKGFIVTPDHKILFFENRKPRIETAENVKERILIAVKSDEGIKFERVIKIETFEEAIPAYCLEVEAEKEEDKNIMLENGIFQMRCDGDEGGMMLLLDALLNFSRKFLPKKRGGTQDAPLVLTIRLDPKAVDDEVYDMDISWKYPLEFYEMTQKLADPGEVVDKGLIEIVKDRLGKPESYFGLGFTHDTSDFNKGVVVTAYKELETMEEKLEQELKVARKIKAVEEWFVALLTIKNHFIKDVKGNFRKFFFQVIRCVNCNEKFRRVPLEGRCPKCGGRLVLTIPEGAVKKYLIHTIRLNQRYKFPEYERQEILLLQQRVESVFGGEVQQGLLKFFNGGKER